MKPSERKEKAIEMYTSRKPFYKIAEIANHLLIAESTVRRWVKEFGLSSTRSPASDEVYELLRLGHSHKDIAAITGRSMHNVTVLSLYAREKRGDPLKRNYRRPLKEGEIEKVLSMYLSSSPRYKIKEIADEVKVRTQHVYCILEKAGIQRNRCNRRKGEVQNG